MVRVAYFERESSVYTAREFSSFEEYINWLDRNRGTRVMQVTRL